MSRPKRWMKLVFTKLRALGYIATHVGSARSVLTEVNTWGRFCVLEALRETGLFDYLREPHTLQDILQHFGFINSGGAKVEELAGGIFRAKKAG